MPTPSILTNPFLNKLRGVNDFQGGYSVPGDVSQEGLSGTLLPASVKAFRKAPAPSIRGYNSMTVPSGMSPLSMDNISGPKKQIDWKGIMGKISSTGKAIAPFASNIANAFRKPPMPAMPQLNNYQTLSKVNMDNERNRVSREVEASSAIGDRNLDANTAAKLRMSNLGTKLNAYSDIAEKERNTNVGIANQQAQMDAQTDYINTERRNEYGQQLVERNLAQQREQGANLANAADKYIAINNEKSKQALDLQKTKTLGLAFSNSGVDQALRAKAKAQGLPDPYGMNYENLETARKDVFGSKKYGGSLKMKKLY